MIVLGIIFFFQSTFALLIAMTGIPGIIFSIVTLKWLREYPSKESYLPEMKKALSLSISSIPTTLSWYLDGFLVSYFFGLNQLAILSVAYMIPEQIKMWAKEVFPIIYALNAKGEDTEEKRAKLLYVVHVGTKIGRAHV